MRKLGNFDARSSETVRRTKRLTRPLTTTKSKQYLSTLRSLGCRLVRVRYLFDLLQF